MESVLTRRRKSSRQPNDQDSLMLCEQLIMLLRTRNEVKFLCNRISLSLRACIVTELALCGFIEIQNGWVSCKSSAQCAPLLREAMNKIYFSRFRPDELMYRLNGEVRGGNIHMKNVRLRVYKSLEEKRLCRIENKNVWFNRIMIINYNTKTELVNYVKEYLIGSKEIDYKAEILVACLVFCSEMEGVTVCMTEKEAIVANAHIKRIKEKYTKGCGDGSSVDSIIFPILKALLCC